MRHSAEWRERAACAAQAIRPMIDTVRTQLLGLRLTPLYAALVALLTTVVRTFPPHLRDALVLHNSTDIANLSSGQLYPLLTSALLIDGDIALGAMLLLMILGTAEAYWGWRRTVATYLAGHVTTTLIVFTLLLLGPFRHAVEEIVVTPDVGVSYGMVTVLGALLATCPLPRRAAIAATLGAMFAAVFLAAPTFTDLGHLVALATGLAMGRTAGGSARRRRTRPRTPPGSPRSEDSTPSPTG